MKMFDFRTIKYNYMSIHLNACLSVFLHVYEINSIIYSQIIVQAY